MQTIFYSSPLIEHVYRSRPPSAAATIPLYLAYPTPRPSLIYLSESLPPVSVFSITHGNLLFLALSEVDSEPLLILEFLHRVVDALEVFIGAPLFAHKVQAHYDVVAQLLNEMCDAGIVCNTEPNALQEVIQVPGWMGKLLGGVGLSGFVLFPGFFFFFFALILIRLLLDLQHRYLGIRTLQSSHCLLPMLHRVLLSLGGSRMCAIRPTSYMSI